MKLSTTSDTVARTIVETLTTKTPNLWYFVSKDVEEWKASSKTKSEDKFYDLKNFGKKMVRTSEYFAQRSF
jgi:hypothetical protein